MNVVDTDVKKQMKALATIIDISRQETLTCQQQHRTWAQ